MDPLSEACPFAVRRRYSGIDLQSMRPGEAQEAEVRPRTFAPTFKVDPEGPAKRDEFRQIRGALSPLFSAVGGHLVGWCGEYLEP